MCRLWLIPTHILRNGYYEIAASAKRLVRARGLECGDSPDIAVIVAPKFAFGIGPVESGREQAGVGVESANIIDVVIAHGGNEFFEFPLRVYRAELDVIGGVLAFLPAPWLFSRVPIAVGPWLP